MNDNKSDPALRLTSRQTEVDQQTKHGDTATRPVWRFAHPVRSSEVRSLTHRAPGPGSAPTGPALGRPTQLPTERSQHDFLPRNTDGATCAAPTFLWHEVYRFRGVGAGRRAQQRAHPLLKTPAKTHDRSTCAARRRVICLRSASDRDERHCRVRRPQSHPLSAPWQRRRGRRQPCPCGR